MNLFQARFCSFFASWQSAFYQGFQPTRDFLNVFGIEASTVSKMHVTLYAVLSTCPSPTWEKITACEVNKANLQLHKCILGSINNRRNLFLYCYYDLEVVTISEKSTQNLQSGYSEAE